MKNADIGQGAEYRRKFQTERLCSMSLIHDHAWARIHFVDMVVAIICMKCGRYPLEIMAMWDVIPGWKK